MEPIKTIGTILDANETRRDAIHVAIMPVVCGDDRLSPGEPVKLIPNAIGHVGRSDFNNCVGVVDPFLHTPVFMGEKFWMFLIPGTITSLRHEWTHPLIDTIPASVPAEPFSAEREASKRWIISFSDRWNLSCHELIYNAEIGNGYVVAEGRDLHSAAELGEDHDLFWHHLEILVGKKFDLDHRGKFTWSCSC